MISNQNRTYLTEDEARASSAKIIAEVTAFRTSAGLGVKVTTPDGNTFTTYRSDAADKAEFIARAKRLGRAAKTEEKP